MKRLIIFLIIFASVNLSWGQSKKTLLKEIERHEERVAELQDEIEKWKSRVRDNNSSYDEILEMNTGLTISNAELTSTNASLVRQLANEKQRSKRAENRADSLQRIVNALRMDSSFVIDPQNEQDSIIKVVQSYFAANIWEDRLDYVLVPKKMESYMAQFYTPYGGSQIVKTEDIRINVDSIQDGDVFKVGIANTIHFMKKENGEFKIDWAASNGLNPMPTKDFKENKPEEGAVFRVIAELNDKYNHPYKKRKDTHWNLDLKTISPNDMFTGYVLKDSEAGEAIYELLKDGRAEIMLKMKMEEGDNSGLVTEILELVSDSWSVD